MSEPLPPWATGDLPAEAARVGAGFLTAIVNGDEGLVSRLWPPRLPSPPPGMTHVASTLAVLERTPDQLRRANEPMRTRPNVMAVRGERPTFVVTADLPDRADSVSLMVEQTGPGAWQVWPGGLLPGGATH